MECPRDHRKLVRHFNEPGQAHELTFSCYQRKPLLNGDLWRAWLSESLDRAMMGHAFDLMAFVYMPEHVHLLVFPRVPSARIDRLLYAIKRPFSFRIKQHLLQIESPLLTELTVQERPGKQAFRFWQEGPGYDRNLTSLKAAITAADYIHRNPVRRGLCNWVGDWRWSSWHHYNGSDEQPDPHLPKVHGFPVA